MTQDEIRLEEDRLDKRYPMMVAAAFIAIMALSIWLAWILLASEQRSILGDGRARKAEPAPAQISGVRQTMISRDREGMRLRQRAHRELENYQWVDREAGTVRIPIRRAMELRARGVKP